MYFLPLGTHKGNVCQVLLKWAKFSLAMLYEFLLLLLHVSFLQEC